MLELRVREVDDELETDLLEEILVVLADDNGSDDDEVPRVLADDCESEDDEVPRVLADGCDSEDNGVSRVLADGCDGEGDEIMGTDRMGVAVYCRPTTPMIV